MVGIGVTAGIDLIDSRCFSPIESTMMEFMGSTVCVNTIHQNSNDLPSCEVISAFFIKWTCGGSTPFISHETFAAAQSLLSTSLYALIFSLQYQMHADAFQLVDWPFRKLMATTMYLPIVIPGRFCFISTFELLLFAYLYVLAFNAFLPVHNTFRFRSHFSFNAKWSANHKLCDRKLLLAQQKTKFQSTTTNQMCSITTKKRQTKFLRCNWPTHWTFVGFKHSNGEIESGDEQKNQNWIQTKEIKFNQNIEHKMKKYDCWIFDLVVLWFNKARVTLHVYFSQM